MGRGAFHLLAIREGVWLLEAQVVSMLMPIEGLGVSWGLGGQVWWSLRREIRSSLDHANLSLSPGKGCVDEEVGDAWVQESGTKAGRVLRKATSRRAISWVEGAWNVVDDEVGVSLLREVM